MEFRGLLAHATAVREAEVTARWSRLATLGADELLLVANGAGPGRAAAATDAGIEAFDPAAIVSTGFCGALSPELAIADLVTATSIEANDRTYTVGQPILAAAAFEAASSERSNPIVMCDRPPSLLGRAFGPAPAQHRTASVSEPDVTFARSQRPLADARDSAARALSGPTVTPPIYAGGGFSTLSPSGSAPRPGAIRSIPYIAQTATEKRNLAANGAIAVEMEAAGVAARAESHGLPLYCIRAVTDLAGESLANDFNKALRLDGQFDTILILKGSLLHPLVRLPELFRLRKRCARAAHVLGDFFAYSRI
jgi:nucleoside phosphorylase